MSLTIQILVYGAGVKIQDLPQHYPDYRFRQALAILDHVVGEAHPWGEGRV
jgi:hypothetical protein